MKLINFIFKQIKNVKLQIRKIKSKWRISNFQEKFKQCFLCSLHQVTLDIFYRQNLFFITSYVLNLACLDLLSILYFYEFEF